MLVRQGRAASGESHPHLQQFLQLRGLVADGVRLSRARLQGKESGAHYARIDDTSPAGIVQTPTVDENGRSVRVEKNSSSSSKVKRSKGTSKSTSRAEASVSATVVAAAAAARVDLDAAGTQAADAAGTAAGDGGRWVHISS